MVRPCWAADSALSTFTLGSRPSTVSNNKYLYRSRRPWWPYGVLDNERIQRGSHLISKCQSLTPTSISTRTWIKQALVTERLN
ncbi:unnamed protein product [Nezara viridula]|uniref:Uncharacterized protein n=1 Tax=Nezara viridula TaxID=85310 RepID=A0A9P0HLZ0_NEZVI|nr:unnamed protein product [Nezara viridula]